MYLKKEQKLKDYKFQFVEQYKNKGSTVEMCITDYSTDGKQHSQHMEKSRDFPTSCKHRFPQLHKTASYTHSHNACCCEIHPILSYPHKRTKENQRIKKEGVQPPNEKTVTVLHFCV